MKRTAENAAALLARGAHTVSMSEAFQACDVDGDGVLNEVEVSGLVGALGYDVDAAYLGGVLNIFGKFDTDRNGFIELREFGALWKHLQGPVLAADEPSALATPRAAGAGQAAVTTCGQGKRLLRTATAWRTSRGRCSHSQGWQRVTCARYGTWQTLAPMARYFCRSSKRSRSD